MTSLETLAPTLVGHRMRPESGIPQRRRRPAVVAAHDLIPERLGDAGLAFRRRVQSILPDQVRFASKIEQRDRQVDHRCNIEFSRDLENARVQRTDLGASSPRAAASHTACHRHHRRDNDVHAALLRCHDHASEGSTPVLTYVRSQDVLTPSSNSMTSGLSRSSTDRHTRQASARVFSSDSLIR